MRRGREGEDAAIFIVGWLEGRPIVVVVGGKGRGRGDVGRKAMLQEILQGIKFTHRGLII